MDIMLSDEWKKVNQNLMSTHAVKVLKGWEGSSPFIFNACCDHGVVSTAPRETFWKPWRWTGAPRLAVGQRMCLDVPLAMWWTYILNAFILPACCGPRKHHILSKLGTTKRFPCQPQGTLLRLCMTHSTPSRNVCKEHTPI